MTEELLNEILTKGYVVALVSVCAFAVVRGYGLRAFWAALLSLAPLPRVALALFLNWGLNMAFVLTTGLFYPWYWFTLTDAAAATLVLHHPAAKAQGLIGWAYIAQIIMHLTFALSGNHFAGNTYLQVLTVLGLVQLLVLGGWASGHRGKHFRSRGRRRPSRLVSQTRREGA